MTIVIMPSTAIARKRRKEKMECQRVAISDTDSYSCNEDEPSKRRRLNENSRRKYQNRYEPDVPMTKEQLAEWRREARKKRNRESAAASRNKVRTRITELEGEVKEWKSKYNALMTRIEQLEQNASSHTAHPPSNMQALVSPHIPPRKLSTYSQEESLPQFPLLNNSQHSRTNRSSTFETSNIKEHHVIEMTSLPAEKRHP